MNTYSTSCEKVAKRLNLVCVAAKNIVGCTRPIPRFAYYYISDLLL